MDALRARGQATLSLVAVEGDRVVGHILFSPVTIESAGESGGTAAALGLGPMAVLPTHQRQGIGSLLVRTGLRRAATRATDASWCWAIPEYYPRFGFKPASRRGVAWAHPAPDEAFMLLELRPGALGGRGGIVRYQPEFGGV